MENLKNLVFNEYGQWREVRNKKFNLNKKEFEEYGKWLISNNDKEELFYICVGLVANEIIQIAKYSHYSYDNSCVACLYCKCTDIETHVKIIKYLLDLNLIPFKKDGSLYNISFKTNKQSANNNYKFNKNFIAEFNLNNFIDLKTKEWKIREITDMTLLYDIKLFE